ncbi:DUF7573 domain-containing protein [Halomicrobium salinisoli]|uniref:DUF7573 domain-containing protein n=1 Tax=Halomicrobium salinisoli TaxID=2878391 RepID=UPI001CEFBF77|nr:hypothetical protein [Halomicrobium salinisoli]
MPEDASLTDFASGDDGESDDGESDDEPASGVEVADESDGDASHNDPADDETLATDDVEPAETTFAWSPDGVCEACGEAAERRWRGEAGLVCGECKEW